MAKAILLLLIAMFSIQFGAGFAKSLFPMVGVAGASTLRLFFAALMLVLLWRPWRYKFAPGQVRGLVFYGVSLGLMNLAFYFSLERIPLGLAVTLEFIGPLALSMLMSRKKIDFLWAAMAGLGIYLVMPKESGAEAVDLIGVIFALIAGLFWAFYIYFGQKAGSALPGGIAASTGMFFAALVVIPFGAAIDAPRLMDWSVLPLGIGVALLSSAVPYSLEMVAMRDIPTRTFGVLMSLEPAIASLVGVVYLREMLSGSQWLAIALVTAASLGSVYSAHRAKERPPLAEPVANE